MAATPETAPGARPRLPFLTKLAYGAGDLGAAIIAGINGFFLLAFLLDVAGLRPAAAGTIFLIIKIWDAVNDPLIGTLSDRTRSRWGRRRPWILFGALPMSVAFFLHWIVPPLGATGLFFYYLVVAVLLDTAITSVNTPYTAMTAELSQDYDERTSLNAFRFSFSIIGGVLAVFLHTVILAAIPDVYTGHAVSAKLGKKQVYYIGMGAWVLVSVLIFFIPQGQVWLLFAAALVASVGVAVAYLMPWSMLPDVIELDELETGQRREGVFYGVFAFLQKTGIALALAASGWVLDLTGYVGATPGQAYPVQPDSALLALRIFVGPAAALILAAGMFVVYLYPITRERHAEIRAELARRKGQPG